MAQTSNLWSRGLFWACLMCTELHLVFAKQPTGLISTEDGVNSYAFYFNLEITNRVFNSSLLDPSSEYYKTTKSEVDDLMNQAFKCSTCSTYASYAGTKDMSFQRGNLIIVRMTILFISSISKYEVEKTFINNPNIQQSDNIEINILYTYENSAEPVTTATTTITTPTTSSIITSDTTTLTPTPTTTTLTTETPTTTPTTTPSSTPSTLTPATSSSTTSTDSSTTGLSHRTSSENNTDDAATNHSTSTTPVYNTTGWITDTDHHISSSTYPTSSTSKPTNSHQEFKSTGTTAYPPVPYWLEWVPGWAIALLVLASLILLLLIILIILLLLRWCCLDEPDEAPKSDMYPQPYHSPYLSHSSAKTPILKHMANEVPRTPEKQKGDRAGMYMVNP